MALIETEEAAGRLARVIASDIQLYNKQKIEAGGDLTAEVEEGYRLFRARVAPALLPVFETVLTDKGLLAGKRAPRARVSPPVAYSAAPGTVSAPPMADTPPPAVETPAPVVAASAPPAPRFDAPTEPSAPLAPARAPEPDLPALPAPEPPRFEAFAEPADGPLPPADEPSVTEERPTFEGARRLARVIISDIRIYNPKKIEAGEDITAEIEEGRRLFKARIGADLLPLFESMLEESGLVKAKPAARPVPARIPTPAAPARVSTPSGFQARVPTPVALPARRPTPATAPIATAPAVGSAGARTPFPFDEPTQALDNPINIAEPPYPRVSTPVPPAEAASALSRVGTPFPGIDVAPLRTPTPFLEGPVMVPSRTPGPKRLPPPIPQAATRPLKPVPLPGSVTPPPVAATPPPAATAQPVSPLGAPTPLPAARFPVVGVPNAAPVAVTTSHRRKPPIRLAVAAASIAIALVLAYVLFQM